MAFRLVHMQRPHFQRLRLACLRQTLVWALALALPVQSVSWVLLQAMGPTHWHTVSAPPSVPAVDGMPRQSDAADIAWALRARVADLAGPRLLALLEGQHTHGLEHGHGGDGGHDHHGHHGHDNFQRHAHAPNDDSVQALGATTGSAEAAAQAHTLDAGGASGPMPHGWGDPHPAQATEVAWPLTQAAAWRSHLSAPPERPPRG
jgi:hypothetical protein